MLKGLQLSSAGIRRASPPPPALHEYVRAVIDTRRAWGGPAEVATPTIPGRSMAASMLRLARVVSERAQRDLGAVRGADPAVVAFMSALPDLLEALAGELDAEEVRSLPLGLCVQR